MSKKSTNLRIKNKVPNHKLHRSFDATMRKKNSHWCDNQITTVPSKRLNIYKEINCDQL